MNEEYNKGMQAGLSIAEDILFCYDNIEVIREKIKEKKSLWKEIEKEFEAMYNKG